MDRHSVERRRAYLQTEATSRDRETERQTSSREKRGIHSNRFSL